MNVTLTSKPEFNGDHLTFDRPRWLDPLHRLGLLTVTAVILAAVFSRAVPNAGFAVALVFLAAACIVLALRPRNDLGMIRFVADRRGLFIPETGFRALFARADRLNWLHIPWTNVASLTSGKLSLDETIGVHGVLLSVKANERERRQFLQWCAVPDYLLHHPRGRKPDAETLLIGFSSVFHNMHAVRDALGRLRISDSVEKP